MQSMTIGKLARATGVGVETVRFYQRRGLLRHPGTAAFGVTIRRTFGGYNSFARPRPQASRSERSASCSSWTRATIGRASPNGERTRRCTGFENR